MENNKKKSIIPTIILTILSLLWIYPIILILLNSLKKESAITTTGVFELPLGEIWNGVTNYVASVTQMDFLKSFWYSLVISVMSVVLILLCCSMCAWYIVRVNGALSKILYYLFVFSMVVPFQMVMFTLAKKRNFGRDCTFTRLDFHARFRASSHLTDPSEVKVNREIRVGAKGPQ